MTGVPVPVVLRHVVHPRGAGVGVAAWEAFGQDAGRTPSSTTAAPVCGCRHPAESVGRFVSDVCADCDADVGDQSSAETCTLCDFRVAVVAAHRLGDVALHVTKTRPLGDDARCLECVLDDLTRLAVQVNR